MLRLNTLVLFFAIGLASRTIVEINQVVEAGEYYRLRIPSKALEVACVSYSIYGDKPINMGYLSDQDYEYFVRIVPYQTINTRLEAKRDIHVKDQLIKDRFTSNSSGVNLVIYVKNKTHIEGYIEYEYVTDHYLLYIICAFAMLFIVFFLG